jgi:hypothetical protein
LKHDARPAAPLRNLLGRLDNVTVRAIVRLFDSTATPSRCHDRLSIPSANPFFVEKKVVSPHQRVLNPNDMAPTPCPGKQ